MVPAFQIIPISTTIDTALLQIVGITVKINPKVPMRISFDPDILQLENVFFTFTINYNDFGSFKLWIYRKVSIPFYNIVLH